MAAVLEAVSLGSLLRGHQRRDGEELEDTDELVAASGPVRQIIEAGQRLDQRGWVPATAGNISLRVDDDTIAITRSGCHKGFLTEDDVMLVDTAGASLGTARPSAETLLHCQIYRELPGVGAVLHGHSVAATVLSMRRGGEIVLSGYEVLKAFEGQRTHEASVAVPVFDNDQNIPRLAETIAPYFTRGMPGGYVIRGHGAYAWGADMPTALARLEALEFLLQCELEKARLP